MQQFDLRQAILHRVQDNSKNEIHETITDSCGADEKTLPGLGVLFEVIWSDSTEDQQTQMVNVLYSHLHGTTNDQASPSY